MNTGNETKKSYPIESKVLDLETVLTLKYTIPPYQRPYEWNEENIHVFFESIIEGYRGKKQVFFGTIQIANNRLNKEVWDIVDGQQRLTSFIILLNLLEKMVNEESFVGVYLETILNSPIKDIFSDNIPRIADKYVENKEHLIQEINSHEEEIDEINSFLNYVRNNLYFVVLTTLDMTLSEVVRVFNTINTTGLDLNASDVFKIRYYDYLCSIDPNKEWMEDINDCYSLVEKTNSDERYREFAKIDMSWILDVYKHIICIEFEFGYSELSKSNLRFFDDLFSDKEYETKRQQNSQVLLLDTFANLVNEFIRHYRWIEENQRKENNALNVMELLSTDLMGKTRYGGRYWTVPFIFSFYSLNNKTNINKEFVYINSLKVSLSFVRYFIVYSVLYSKVINDVQNKMCKDYLPLLKMKEADEICDVIEKQMWYQWDANNRDDNDLWEKRGFIESIQTNLFDNGSRTHLICTLSAVINEISNKKNIVEIRKLFFNWKDNPYDIEHIYARNLFKDDKEFISLMNGIGNLIVLERSINRNIKDKPVAKKIKKYKESEFQAVKDLCENKDLENWDINAVKTRSIDQINKIMDFMKTDNYDKYLKYRL